MEAFRDSLLPMIELYSSYVLIPSVECVLTGLARVHGFTFGDSLDESKKNKWKEFGSRLTKVPSLLFLMSRKKTKGLSYRVLNNDFFFPFLAAPKLRTAMDFDS